MPARSQELKIGIGYKKQTGTGTSSTTSTQLQTALVEGNLWSLGLNAFNVPFPVFNQENDSEFFGKGNEFVSEIFPTSLDIPWEWAYHLTSQNAAMVGAFALGDVTPTTPAGGAYQYVCTPMDPGDAVNLPATTIVAGIRQGTAGEILDHAAVGMVCTGFTLNVRRGPGLQNTQLTSRWAGCGKYIANSGLTIPSKFDEKRLGAGSATALSLNGVNYLTNARFVDLELTYENNPSLDGGFFPGSGSQDGFDVRGRMRYGRRSLGLRWTVELEADSTELSDLLSGVEGVGQLVLTGPLITGSTYHKLTVDIPHMRNRAFRMSESDGFVVANIETDLMDDSSGPLIWTVVTDQANIGAAA